MVGDELYFYCSGRSGRASSTGLAVLLRDGFASMDAGAAAGTLTTRPVLFRGRRLFVNASVPGGELRAEVLDEAGAVIGPFSAAGCVAVRGDGTRQEVRWEGAADLAAVAGRAVRLRFHLRAGVPGREGWRRRCVRRRPLAPTTHRLTCLPPS